MQENTCETNRLMHMFKVGALVSGNPTRKGLKMDPLDPFENVYMLHACRCSYILLLFSWQCVLFVHTPTLCHFWIRICNANENKHAPDTNKNKAKSQRLSPLRHHRPGFGLACQEGPLKWGSCAGGSDTLPPRWRGCGNLGGNGKVGVIYEDIYKGIKLKGWWRHQKKHQDKMWVWFN